MTKKKISGIDINTNLIKDIKDPDVKSLYMDEQRAKGAVRHFSRSVWRICFHKVPDVMNHAEEMPVEASMLESATVMSWPAYVQIMNLINLILKQLVIRNPKMALNAYNRLLTCVSQPNNDHILNYCHYLSRSLNDYNLEHEYGANQVRAHIIGLLNCTHKQYTNAINHGVLGLITDALMPRDMNVARVPQPMVHFEANARVVDTKTFKMYLKYHRTWHNYILFNRKCFVQTTVNLAILPSNAVANSRKKNHIKSSVIQTIIAQFKHHDRGSLKILLRGDHAAQKFLQSYPSYKLSNIDLVYQFFIHIDDFVLRVRRYFKDPSKPEYRMYCLIEGTRLISLWKTLNPNIKSSILKIAARHAIPNHPITRDPKKLLMTLPKYKFLKYPENSALPLMPFRDAVKEYARKIAHDQHIRYRSAYPLLK